MKQVDSQEKKSIRLSIFFVAILIVIANTYWIGSTWNGFSLNSLFINAVFITFLLSFFSILLGRIRKRLALRPAEIFLVYMMLAVSTASAGHDTVEMLTQVIGYPFWFSAPENEWEDLFFKDLPRWLMMDNRRILEGFYTEDAKFYEARVFNAWIRPIGFWASFLIVMYFCMMCINIILRKQWMDRERLSFPVAQVPMGLIEPNRRVFKSKIFWYGFSGVVILSFLNGLHQLYPVVPGPTYGKYDLSQFFTERPWNAMDAVYIEFLPFILGLAFFIPITLLY